MMASLRVPGTTESKDAQDGSGKWHRVSFVLTGRSELCARARALLPLGTSVSRGA